MVISIPIDNQAQIMTLIISKIPINISTDTFITLISS